MAFDQPTRNRLARFVGEARNLLTTEFTRQLQHEYGMDPTTGTVSDLAKLSALDDSRRQSARLLRITLAHYLSGSATTGNLAAKARKEALERIVREQAFTVLNRLCALRMAESRGLVIESIASGYQSKGFQLYARLAGSSLGETGDAYRAYLFSLFDEFAVDLPVLFDRFSPQGRLFPRLTVLLQLLSLINDVEIAPLWAEDEAIGWIYQYFNSKEERKQMRDESQAPRNSRELAVRNQFFTPRYVVEFLTDNTLGRIWYEMTQGQTGLVERCRYLVRRPTEIFLQQGESAPDNEELGTPRADSPFARRRANSTDAELSQEEEPSTPRADSPFARGRANSADAELSQEELLRQPVYIPFRPLKDPRTILMLDPACGSMHFGLYSFDLYETIYDEAWELEEQLGEAALLRADSMPSLHESYPDKASFVRDVPRLIIEQNIHGIDIDPRAVQIAGLSLWLRAQRRWHGLGVKPQDRPQIARSNIVCAEPMPGDRGMLEEFLKNLRDERLESLIRRVLNVPENQRVRATPTMADALCDLVRTVWQEMELAGEAGSLLKIEESLATAIAQSRQEWDEKLPLFRVTEFSLTEQPKVRMYKSIPGEEEDFWDRAEALVLAALAEYAQQAESDGYQRRLFADDAARGFAFIDLCRKRYDVVLANPPFGREAISTTYLLPKDAAGNVYTAFVIRGSELSNAFVGVISDKTFVVQQSFTPFRQRMTSKVWSISLLVELGWGILDDADVQVAAYIVRKGSVSTHLFAKLNGNDLLESSVENLVRRNNWTILLPDTIAKLPGYMFAHGLPASYLRILENSKQLNQIASLPRGLGSNNANRTYKAWYEVPVNSIGETGRYRDLCNGGGPSPFFRDDAGVAEWVRQDGKLLVEHGYSEVEKAYDQKNYDRYFDLGLSFPKQSTVFNVAALTKDAIPTREGKAIIPKRHEDLVPLLAYLNSSFVRFFVDATNGLHKQSGPVGMIPVPDFDISVQAQLGKIAIAIYQELSR